MPLVFLAQNNDLRQNQYLLEKEEEEEKKTGQTPVSRVKTAGKRLYLLLQTF